MFVMVSKDNFNEIVTLINGQTHFITIFSKYIFGVCVSWRLNFIVFRRCLHCSRCSLSSLISWLSWLAIQVFWFYFIYLIFFFLLFYFLDKFRFIFYFKVIFSQDRPLLFDFNAYIFIIVWCYRWYFNRSVCTFCNRSEKREREHTTPIRWHFCHENELNLNVVSLKEWELCACMCMECEMKYKFQTPFLYDNLVGFFFCIFD